MAGEKSLNYRTSCTDDDEIEGLNEKLLQLLSAQKVLSQIPKSQSLCDDRLENNSNSKVGFKVSASSLFSHCRHECSLLHHDSPVNIPTLPIHLPPIGVFWDIENCQVSLLLLSKKNLSLM